MILKNKICIITGSTGGLGEEIIKQMIDDKVKIIAIAKSKKKLEKIKKKFKKNIINYYSCNFSNNDEIIKTIEKIKKLRLKIDILVNCAAQFKVKNFNKFTQDEINQMININLIAPIFFTKAILPSMKKNKWGRIINIGSSSSYEGFENSVLYCTTKHGLLGFSRSVNNEFKKFGIRSYIFSPGSIKTNMGKLVKNQNYKNFIDPKELASFINYIIKQNNNMITEEIKINRIKYN